MTDKQVFELPHSQESEMMVLGCMMNKIDDLNFGVDLLQVQDFYFRENQIVFMALKRCYSEDKPSEVYILMEDLKADGDLEKIGGLNYLMALEQFCGIGTDLEAYCEIVKDKSSLRKMFNASGTIAKISLSNPHDVSGALENAQKLIFDISQSFGSRCGSTIADILSGKDSESKKSFIEILEERQERFKKVGHIEGEVTGVPTGFIDLDKILHGMNNSNLMILAARPSMGKTAFAINIAENVCYKSKIPVGVFSLEMDRYQLAQRMICSMAEIPSDEIVTGRLSSDGLDFQKVNEIVNEMQKGLMIIDDTASLKIIDLRVRAKRMKETHKIGFLVIDYLQLIGGSGTKSSKENRQLEVSEISRMLKQLAKELNIPILCLSQLSRKAEEKEDITLKLSHLRESGAIEQDADIVLLLNRPDAYQGQQKIRPGEADVFIAKNRHGSIGKVILGFRKHLAKFVNIEKSRKPIDEE